MSDPVRTLDSLRPEKQNNRARIGRLFIDQSPQGELNRSVWLGEPEMPVISEFAVIQTCAGFRSGTEEPIPQVFFINNSSLSSDLMPPLKKEVTIGFCAGLSIEKKQGNVRWLDGILVGNIPRRKGQTPEELQAEKAALLDGVELANDQCMLVNLSGKDGTPQSKGKVIHQVRKLHSSMRWQIMRRARNLFGRVI